MEVITFASSEDTSGGAGDKFVALAETLGVNGSTTVKISLRSAGVDTIFKEY